MRKIDFRACWNCSMPLNGGMEREGISWWAHQDSNLEPDGYEPSALTIELWALHAARMATAIRGCML